MTSKLLLHLIVCVLIAGTTCPVVGAQVRRTRPRSNPIHVSVLNSAIVVGSLGVPLGEVLTIEGIAADENYTKRRADSGDILLRVQTVNGKALKHEAIFPFSPFEGAEMTKPSAGMRFKYVGYETGGFSGIPEGAFAYVPRVPTSGYYFTTSFVVLRDHGDSKTSMKTAPE